MLFVVGPHLVGPDFITKAVHKSVVNKRFEEVIANEQLILNILLRILYHVFKCLVLFDQLLGEVIALQVEFVQEQLLQDQKGLDVNILYLLDRSYLFNVFRQENTHYEFINMIIKILQR